MIEIRFDKTKDEVALLIWFLVDHSVCNVLSKGKLCSNNSKSVLYLPNIYVSVARVAEDRICCFYINKKDLFVCFHIIIKLILFEDD
jgi:hypothetical protein